MSAQHFDTANEVLTDLLEIAERQFGLRDGAWSVGAVQIHSNGPYLNPDRGRMVATVYVNPYVNNHLPNLFAQIAHETIHLLNPGPLTVNCLEEGIACIFQDQIVLERFGNAELKHQLSYRDSGYKNAKSLVERLHAFDDNAFMLIRSRVGAFHRATPSDLIDLFADLTEEHATQLCTLCRPRR